MSIEGERERERGKKMADMAKIRFLSTEMGIT
jgi:hypothetical protein